MKKPISKKLARGLKRAWPKKKAAKKARPAKKAGRAASVRSKMAEQVKKDARSPLGHKAAELRFKKHVRKDTPNGRDRLISPASTRVDTSEIRTRKQVAPVPPQWLVLFVPTVLAGALEDLVASMLRSTVPGWRWWIDDSSDAIAAARASAMHAATHEGSKVEFTLDSGFEPPRLYADFVAKEPNANGSGVLVVVRFAPG